MATKKKAPDGKTPLPYTATVNVSLAVLRRGPDMGKPIGTLKKGTVVKVADRQGNAAQLTNGLWVREDFLTPGKKPT
ncbi:MAG: hypothetical protein Q4C45_05035 [Oscillospiraceae bacterium]|nr:hypothetical protein [Oscillospiraceae bacterium]